MKLNIGLLLIASASAGGPQGSIPTCAEQEKCFTWTVGKIGDTDCDVGGACTVEVCMNINTTLDGCDKSGGTISHICDMSDDKGCVYDQEGYSMPVFDYGDESSNCPATIGKGENADGFTGKCNNVDQVLLCQEGAPGDTLHFILKDGNDKNDDIYTPYDGTGLDTTQACDAVVTCRNNLYSCGNNTKQMEYERVWSYTIPDGLDGSCTYCDESPTGAPSSTATQEKQPISNPAGKPSPAPVPSPSGTNGDPHFKTWANEHFEYHGQCDMVLVKDKNFADGLGLDVQIRTKLVRFWSYIKSVAIRIGDDILEIQGSVEGDELSTANYWMNFEYQAPLTTVGGFPVTFRKSEVKSMKRYFTIDLTSKYPGVKINVVAYKEFIRVDFENHSQEAFGNTVGMLGDYVTGKTLARDGKTELDDFTKLGNEWQLLPVEDMLFHSTEQPQFPKKCIEPEDPQGERRRRLDENTVSMEQAEAACASIKDPLDRKDCIYDVMATQDLDMVGAF